LDNRVVRCLEQRCESGLRVLDILLHSLDRLGGTTVGGERRENYSDEGQQLEHTQDNEENDPAIALGQPSTRERNPHSDPLLSIHPHMNYPPLSFRFGILVPAPRR
jgi:hypothetical protein